MFLNDVKNVIAIYEFTAEIVSDMSLREYLDSDHFEANVYIIYCPELILYIGESESASDRVEEHVGSKYTGRGNLDLHDLVWSDQGKTLDTFRVIFINSQSCRKSLESKLIYELCPLFNSKGKRKHRPPSLPLHYRRGESTVAKFLGMKPYRGDSMEVNV